MKEKLTQDQIDKLVSIDNLDVQATIFGIGRVDTPFQHTINRKAIWQYDVWRGMLARAYCPRFKSSRPTYDGVSICNEWHSLSKFTEWANKEVLYSGKPDKSHLEKDILVKGNRTYTPETCGFVPVEINTLILTMSRVRDGIPIGVHVHRNKYIATINRFGKSCHLGSFSSADAAHLCYKQEKEAHVREVALLYRGVLSDRMYDALLRWEV